MPPAGHMVSQDLFGQAAKGIASALKDFDVAPGVVYKGAIFLPELDGREGLNMKNPWWHLAAILGAVLAVLLFSMFREKPIKVPADDKHRPFIEKLVNGESPAEVEKGCPDCHNPQTMPLDADHPANQKCLVCHPVQG